MTDEQLLKTLLTRLEGVLNGGSEKPSASSDNYIAWCAPGLPFQTEDLLFAIKGINGKTAEETNQLVRTSAEFAGLVNSIPSSNFIDSSGTFEQNGKKLWDVYSDVLRFSTVPDDDLSEKEKEVIERFRKLLVTEETKEDLFSGEMVTIVRDSDIVKAYKEKEMEYSNAVLFYNNKRLAALNADSNMAVQDFAMNAKTYERAVNMALNDWVSSGHKNDLDKIYAYIKQTSQRSMALLKNDLQNKFELSVMTNPNDNADFYPTSIYPGSFITSDKGWTEFSFTSSNKNQSSKESESLTTASAGMKFGLWSAGADATVGRKEINQSIATDDFSMKFKMTQVSIGRGWFSPDFLLSDAWDWDVESYKMLSDGEAMPSGRLIAYPTTAIFIKDVEITSSNMKGAYDELNKSTEAGASGGWGPFRVSSKHSSKSREQKSSLAEGGNSLRIEGMQLIAFKCVALPKTPNYNK